MRCDASPYGVGAVLLHRLPSGVAVYIRLSSNENWQPVTVIESEGEIVTLEFTDGRVLRKHKDNAGCGLMTLRR